MAELRGPFVSHASAEDWEPFALGELEIGGVHWLRAEEGDDGTYYAGLWRIGPGEFPPEVAYDMTMDETIQIFEGEVTIQVVDGPTLELVPGSIASFCAGTRTRWRFTKVPFKELFVLS